MLRSRSDKVEVIACMQNNTNSLNFNDVAMKTRKHISKPGSRSAKARVEFYMQIILFV